MAYLIGSATTTRFSSTKAVNSLAGANKAWINGNATDGLTPVAGTAATLDVYISSWGSQANAKFCIYEDDALLDTVIIPSSAGTGVVSGSLVGTDVLDITKEYRIAVYTEDADDITLFTDTSGLTLRISTASGDYTTPIDPLPTGSFESTNEFYWAIQDAGAPTTEITSISDPIPTGSAVVIGGTTFEAAQGTGNVTQEGISLTETAWADTEITATSIVVEDTVKKYGTHTFGVTSDSSGSDTTLGDVTPESGNDYVNLSTLATAGDRITAIADLASGDQLRHEAFLQQGLVTTAYTVVVQIDGTFTVGNGPVPNGTYEFEVRANDGTGWGTAADQTTIFSGGTIISSGTDITPSQALSNALKAQGFVGGLADLQAQWLESLGFSTGTLNDNWAAMLTDSSVPDGGFNERLKYFYETELGLTPGVSTKSINELKRDYWLTQ